MRKRKLELLQATTVVECAKALKSWETEDFGQGHDQGGTNNMPRTAGLFWNACAAAAGLCLLISRTIGIGFFGSGIVPQ